MSKVSPSTRGGLCVIPREIPRSSLHLRTVRIRPRPQESNRDPPRRGTTKKHVTAQIRATSVPAGYEPGYQRGQGVSRRDRAPPDGSPISIGQDATGTPLSTWAREGDADLPGHVRQELRMCPPHLHAGNTQAHPGCASLEIEKSFSVPLSPGESEGLVTWRVSARSHCAWHKLPPSPLQNGGQLPGVEKQELFLSRTDMSEAYGGAA